MVFNTLHNFEDIYVKADLHLSNIVNRTISLRGFTNPQEHTQYIRNIINSTIKSKRGGWYAACGNAQPLLLQQPYPQDKRSA